MSCEKIEELLSLYVEDALSVEERRRVDDHLAVCGSCRESLVSYRALESSLVSRRELRPPAGRTAAAVIERLRPRRYHRPVVGWIGAPGLTSAAFLLASVVLFVFRASIADFFERIGHQLGSGYSHLIAEWTQGVVRAAGGSEWVLLAVYLGVFAFIMLAGSWMVLRLVRE